MNINELTIGQAREIASLVNGGQSNNRNSETLTGGMVGKKVIIRTYSAGVWFGTLSEKSGKEVILTDARRMWKWWASKGISLSACALYGVKHSESKIIEPVSQVWLEATEIISCTDAAIQSIGGAPHVEAK